MFRHERYAQGRLVERVEIERQSPSVVRCRRWDGQGNLAEDRPATESEQATVDKVDAQEAREQAHRDFRAGVNALPGANPLKAILQNLLRWKE